jgi:hypothetical protein
MAKKAKPKQFNIKNPACRTMLDQFAREDAAKRASGKPDRTATLYEILCCEKARREAAAEPAQRKEEQTR